MPVSVESFYLKKGQSDSDLLQRKNFLCSDNCKAQMFCFACMSHTSVLVSAGIELIFLLAAGAVLWFGFSMRIILIMLIDRELFSFPCFANGETYEKLGGDTARTADPRGIPYHMASHSSYEAGGRRRKGGGDGGRWEGWWLSSQVTITCDRALFSWRWLNTCLPMGNSE